MLLSSGGGGVLLPSGGATVLLPPGGVVVLGPVADVTGLPETGGAVVLVPAGGVTLPSPGATVLVPAGGEPVPPGVPTGKGAVPGLGLLAVAAVGPPRVEAVTAGFVSSVFVSPPQLAKARTWKKERDATRTRVLLFMGNQWGEETNTCAQRNARRGDNVLNKSSTSARSSALRRDS